MNQAHKVDLVLEEVLDHIEEYLEMVPDMSTRHNIVIKLLATLVARERSHIEYLTRRIEEIERRLQECKYSRIPQNG